MSREDEVQVTLAKDEVSHKPLKSAARSFRDTRRKFAMALEGDNTEDLLAFLEKTKSDTWLRRPERDDSEGEEGGKRRRRRGRRNNRRKPGNDDNTNASAENPADDQTAEPVSDGAGAEVPKDD